MTPPTQVVRGEIWLADFGVHPEDPEQAFQRPALIVSDDRLHHPRLRIAIVVPGTSSARAIPLHVTVSPNAGNGLTVDTDFQLEQVRAISTSRLQRRLGRLDLATMHAVDEILRTVLSL